MSKRVAEKIRRLERQNRDLIIEVARLKMVESDAVHNATLKLQIQLHEAMHKLVRAEQWAQKCSNERDVAVAECQWTRDTVKKHLKQHPLNVALILSEKS